MPENFQVPAALNEMYFFIQQLCLSLQRIYYRALALTTYDKFLNLSDGMHFSTQQIITSNLKSYHICHILTIEKRFPEEPCQLIHKCRKNHSILRDISCGTTCKKLHFIYLFFYQTTRSFAPVVLSQDEISLLNEYWSNPRRGGRSLIWPRQVCVCVIPSQRSKHQ